VHIPGSADYSHAVARLASEAPVGIDVASDSVRAGAERVATQGHSARVERDRGGSNNVTMHLQKR
jgi:hypothetical protein